MCDDRDSVQMAWVFSVRLIIQKVTGLCTEQVDQNRTKDF